jgi:hypothetical protein
MPNQNGCIVFFSTRKKISRHKTKKGKEALARHLLCAGFAAVGGWAHRRQAVPADWVRFLRVVFGRCSCWARSSNAPIGGHQWGKILVGSEISSHEVSTGRELAGPVIDRVGESLGAEFWAKIASESAHFFALTSQLDCCLVSPHWAQLPNSLSVKRAWHNASTFQRIFQRRKVFEFSSWTQFLFNKYWNYTRVVYSSAHHHIELLWTM